MILQDHLAGVINGAAHSRQLHQYIGTVIALFYHPLDFFQVADGPGQAVDHSLLVLVDMAMAVGNAVLMHIGMVVGMLHGSCPPLDFLLLYAIFPPLASPPGGYFQENVLTAAYSSAIIN